MSSKSRSRSIRLDRLDPSDFWAALTIGAFPLAMFIASLYGYSPIAGFLFGIAASITMLVSNALAEERLWMFAPKWRARFEHRDFSLKLALVTGALLLITETFLLVVFFTEGSLDQALVNLVFSRQCQTPTVTFEPFCDTLRQRYQLEP